MPLRTSPQLYEGILKTDKEVYHDILEITMAIEELYPELSKYLDELPTEVSETDHPNLEISRNSLACYHQTLDALLTGYADHHP